MEKPTSRLILTNAKIFSENQIISGYLIIEGHIIKEIGVGSYLQSDQAVKFSDSNLGEILDVKEALVLPGFIDMHVHFRDSKQIHKETLESGSLGALHGGVTSVMTMPNTNPPLSTPEAIKEYLKRMGEQQLYCNIGLYTAVKQGFNLKDLPEMKKLGIRGIKIYPGDSSEDLELDWNPGWRSDLDPAEFSAEITNILKNFQNEYESWKKLFEAAKEHELPLLFHPEFPRESESTRKIYEQGLKIAEIEHSPNPHLFAHHVSHPVFTNELALVEMLIAFLYKFFPEPDKAPHIHFVHVSSSEVVDVIHLMLKSKGYPCSIEVSPHHLLLHYDLPFFSENWAKVLVPLRSPENQENLKQEWTNNRVDTVGTDHAPHTQEEKEQDFFKAPSGFPSIDFAGLILLSEYFEGKINLEQLVQMYSTRPAELLKLPHKGKIATGMDADVIVVKQVSSYKISRDMIKSRQKWTPWENYPVCAEIDYVIMGGQIAYDRSKNSTIPLGNFLWDKADK